MFKRAEVVFPVRVVVLGLCCIGEPDAPSPDQAARRNNGSRAHFPLVANERTPKGKTAILIAIRSLSASSAYAAWC